MNGAYSKDNVCSSWTTRCNEAAGWHGWCNDGWDHHCCFQERIPAAESCVEPDRSADAKTT